VHEAGSLSRTVALATLSAQKRNYRIVYHNCAAGQHAAAARGMAIATLTWCSVPPDLKILVAGTVYPRYPTLTLRSSGEEVCALAAVDAMHEQIVLAVSKSIGQNKR
jgi:hypothetical protein